VFRTIAITTAVATGTFLVSSTPIIPAPGKCRSIQAQCAIEIGGRCDPVTGRWEYGRSGSGGTNRGGAFDACIARKLGQRK